MFRVVAAPAKFTVVAVVLKSVREVAAVAKVNVPVPTFRVVAAPAKFTVVALVLISANVVEVVVSGDTTLMPAANGTEDVVVCEPSLRTQVDSAVANSDQVEVADDELIVVPDVGVGANELLVNVNVPDANGISGSFPLANG